MIGLGAALLVDHLNEGATRTVVNEGATRSVVNEGATRSVVNEGATRSVVITNRAPHRISTNFELRTETTTVAVLYQLL
jgi:hypothetical protein